MRHFCDLEPQPGATPQMSWLQRKLWTKPSHISAESMSAARGFRVIPGGDAKQPGPYWTIEAERVLIVGIDTGISGVLDDAQGRWLLRVSEDPRPKVLITGKPLIVDGVHKHYAIEWEDDAPAGFNLVSDVAFHPAHKYLAVIGGDIHNYQRYLGRLPDGSWQTHIVAGGGGAFMHATHKIPKVAIHDGIACTEDDFRCYPLRGDSLSRYSSLIGRQRNMEGLTWISPCQGSLLMADELHRKPSRPGCEGEKLQSTTRLRGTLVRHLGGKVFQRFFSEFLDWDDPPMFKHILRLDVTRDKLHIRCLAATGCAGPQQISPPVEDEVVIPLER